MHSPNRKIKQTSLPTLTSPSITASPSSASNNRYFRVPQSPNNAKSQESSSFSYDGDYRSPCRSPLLPKSPIKSPQLPPKPPSSKSHQLPPKSPLKSPLNRSPTCNKQNYFNFNNVPTPLPTKTKYMKAFSQNDTIGKGSSSTLNGGVPKTILTKTQSEPRTNVTFEVNSQPLISQKNYDAQFNIQTNPGYNPVDTKRRNDSLESGDTMITTATLLSSRRLSDNRKSSNATTKSAQLIQCRKSTSDLTQMTEINFTELSSSHKKSVSRPASPSRRGSIKSGLAYLASRRGSKDSNASMNEEDIGPLNFQNSARARNRRTSNFLELPVPDHVRPRISSLPEKAYNPRLNDDLYRLRTFSITNKGGVVNCGDSIINRRSKSNTSVNSATSKHSGVSNNGSPYEGPSSCCSGYNAVDSSSIESEGTPRSLSHDEDETRRYRVVLLGDSGVGKTALVSQFMTSEYMNTYDASLDDEFGEKTVSILLDGEESEMIFIDHPTVEMSVENSLATYEPHACVVVYSIVAAESFKVVEDILNYLWRENYTHEKSVIVVGNKADLARSRVISVNDGKSLAISRDCKFIETSSGIQHNVDELLVGILKQVRLRELRDKKKDSKLAGSTAKSRRKLHGSKTSLSLNIAREILQKMCLNDITKSKSCENLHVL